jgi:hypothetical protein
MISKEELTELIPLLHRLHRQVHPNDSAKDDACFEEDCGSISQALLHGESLYQDFDELQIVKTLKALIASRLGNAASSSALEAEVVASIDPNEAKRGDSRAQLESKCHGVAHNLCAEISALESIVKNIVATLGEDELLNTRQPSLSKRHPDGDSHLASFNFDDLPEYEPLESTLENLRRNPCDKSMLMKLFEIDCEDLVGHPQWCELLTLLSRTMHTNECANTPGASEDTQSNDICGIKSKSARELSLLVQLRFMCAFSGQQSIDIMQNVLAYILHCWIKTGTVSKSDDTSVSHENLALEEETDVLVRCFAVILKELLKHLAYVHGKELDRTVATTFIILAKGYITVKCSSDESNEPDAVEMGEVSSAKRGQRSFRLASVRSLSILDVLCAASNTILVDFFASLAAKYAPISLLSHMLHSELYWVLFESIRDSRGGHTPEALVKFNIWLSVVATFVHQPLVCEFLCSLESSERPRSDEMEKEDTGMTSIEDEVGSRTMPRELVLRHRESSQVRFHESVVEDDSSQNGGGYELSNEIEWVFHSWNGLYEDITKDSEFNKPTASSLREKKLLPVMKPHENMNQKYHILSGGTVLTDRMGLFDILPEIRGDVDGDGNSNGDSDGGYDARARSTSITCVNLTEILCKLVNHLTVYEMQVRPRLLPPAVYSVKSCQQLSLSRPRVMHMEVLPFQTAHGTKDHSAHLHQDTTALTEKLRIQGLTRALLSTMKLMRVCESNKLCEAVSTSAVTLLKMATVSQCGDSCALSVAVMLLDKMVHFILDIDWHAITGDALRDKYLYLVVQLVLALLNSARTQLQTTTHGVIMEAKVSVSLIRALNLLSGSRYFNERVLQADDVCQHFARYLEQQFNHIIDPHMGSSDQQIFDWHSLHKCQLHVYTTEGLLPAPTSNGAGCIGKCGGSRGSGWSGGEDAHISRTVLSDAVAKLVGVCSCLLTDPTLFTRLCVVHDQLSKCMCAVVMAGLCNESCANHRERFDEPCEVIGVNRYELVDALDSAFRCGQFLDQAVTHLREMRTIPRPFDQFVFAMRREFLTVDMSSLLSSDRPIVRLLLRLADHSYGRMGLVFTLLSVAVDEFKYPCVLYIGNRSTSQSIDMRQKGSTNAVLAKQTRVAPCYEPSDIAKIFERLLYLRFRVPGMTLPVWPILLELFFTLLHNSQFCAEVAAVIRTRCITPPSLFERPVCDWLFHHECNDFDCDFVNGVFLEESAATSVQSSTEVCMENILLAHAKCRLAELLPHVRHASSEFMSSMPALSAQSPLEPQSEAEVRMLASFIESVRDTVPSLYKNV